MNILIIKVSALGDIIHTLPALHLIKYHLPQARIHWIIQKKAADIIAHHPLIFKSWILPDNYLHPKNSIAFFSTIHQLRSITWDAIIDFQGLLKTSCISALLSGKKIGFSYEQARCSLTSFGNHLTANIDYSNIIQKNLGLASFACSYLTQTTHSPTLSSLIPAQKNSSQKATYYDWIDSNKLKNTITISPNTTWESKHWPIEHWKILLTQLSHQQYHTLLIGAHHGNQGAELARYIQENNLATIIAPAIPLFALKNILEQTALFIGPDTGLLHWADYLGTETIGIFGPTHTITHGPFIQTRNINNAIQIECPHHYEKKHQNRSNTSTSANCMFKLHPNDLLIKIKNILG